MERRRTELWRVTGVVVIIAALCAVGARFLAWPQMVVLREMYRFCEAVGFMKPGGALGGQVAGFNFQREPAWVHPVARTAAALVVCVPVFLGAMLLFQRVVWGRGRLGRTLCGACGGEFGRRNEGGSEQSAEIGGAPVCACGNDLRLPREGGPGAWWLSARMGPARAVFVRVAVIAVGAAAIPLAVFHGLDLRWRIMGWILELGEGLGGQVTRLGRVVGWGAQGPFSGGRTVDHVFNALVRSGPDAFGVFAAGVVLLGVAQTLLRLDSSARRRRSVAGRWISYRGPTLCGRCRSELAGIRERRCTECSRAF